MESLFSEGELKYLRILSSKKTIYREKVFWDQLVKWNIDAFLGVQNAELLLETVVEGFRDRVITFKSMRTGRPPKSLPPDINIREEYFKVQQELLKHAIIDYPKKDIDKYCSEVEKGIVSKQNPQVNIERRKRNLTTFLQEKKLEFSNTEIGKMIRKSNSEISIKLLSKQYDVGTKMIKELLDKSLGKLTEGQFNTAWVATFLISMFTPSPISTISFTIFLVICFYSWMR